MEQARLIDNNLSNTDLLPLMRAKTYMDYSQIAHHLLLNIVRAFGSRMGGYVL